MTPHNLKPLPVDGKFYCGPAALAAFTGLDPRIEIRRVVNAQRGKPAHHAVKWMDMVGEIPAVLKRLGVKHGPLQISTGTARMTLARFIHQFPRGDYLVRSSGHVMAISNGHLVDEIRRVPVSGDKLPRPKRRITHYIEIFNAHEFGAQQEAA